MNKNILKCKNYPTGNQIFENKNKEHNEYLDAGRTQRAGRNFQFKLLPSFSHFFKRIS